MTESEAGCEQGHLSVINKPASSLAQLAQLLPSLLAHPPSFISICTISNLNCSTIHGCMMKIPICIMGMSGSCNYCLPVNSSAACRHQDVQVKYRCS